jgi:hypothetical protein
MSLCSFPLFSRLPFLSCSISASTHHVQKSVYIILAPLRARGDAGQRGGRGPCSRHSPCPSDIPRTELHCRCIATFTFPQAQHHCARLFVNTEREQEQCRDIAVTTGATVVRRRRKTSIPTLTPRRPRTTVITLMRQTKVAAATMMPQRSRKRNRATQADARSTDTVTGQPRATGPAPPALTRAATAMQVTAMIVTTRGRNATAAGTNGIARAE